METTSPRAPPPPPSLDMGLDERLAALADGLHRIDTDGAGAAIAKVRRRAPPGFFAAEARGLEALRATRTLRVPEVHAVTDTAILIEDLGRGTPQRADWTRAGAALARLHGVTRDCFGFDADGWCGDTPQDNTPDDDGHRFFAERRLRPQARRARDRGLLDADDARRVERIADRLKEWLPNAPAALIHGDLWTGNLHACANGELALIDGGAVHHGWAEADLAMLTLFGAPPESFFAAYEAESHASPDWRERAPLYNLYHLLNHLNLFGSGYLDGVRRVLRRYS